MSEEAPLFDAPAFDVDGQATVTSGTWSFDSSFTINSSEVNVTGVALELNVAAISVVADVALLASVTLSRIPFAYELNLIETTTIDYSPYADATDTTLKREIVVGDPESKEHGIVMEQFFYGETHMTCGIARENTKQDFYLKCYGNSKVKAGGMNEIEGKDLSLFASDNATIQGNNNVLVLTNHQSFLNITKDTLTAQANDVYISGSGKVEISAPKDSLQLLGQKVNIDSPAAVPPPKPPKPPKPSAQPEAPIAEQEVKEIAAQPKVTQKAKKWKGSTNFPYIKWG